MDINGYLRRRFNKSSKSNPKKSVHKNDMHQSFKVTNSIYTAIGLICMYKLSEWCFSYFKLLHENDLWFSKLKVSETIREIFHNLNNKKFLLKNVEREISFRTESGLYYSYFKELTNSPNFHNGISI